VIVAIFGNPRKGTALLRKGRYSEFNRIYHITTATYQRTPIFNNLLLGRCVVRALMRQHQDGHIESLAFVVMPDHLHWLLQLRSDRTLSVCMNLVKSLSAREIRHRSGMRETVWQRGYHDRALRKEDDVVRIARYIIANPLRGGLVNSIRQYPLWDAKWL